MAIFIIFTFIGFWLILGNLRRDPDWRVSFVQALIVWATYLTLTTELLSLFNWVTLIGLSIVWVTPCIIFVVLFWLGFKKGRVLRFPIIYHLRSRIVAFMDVLILIIMVVTLVIAFVSPPNSLEAMTYRLPRIAHWAQQHNLDHYSVASEYQTRSEGFEIILLNFFIMAKGDGWSNIINWLALFGILEAIMGISATFGSTPKGTRLSALFAVSLPIAIAQASSSLNDMVLGLWIIGCVLMVVVYRGDGFKPIYIILAGLSAGLAVLTKPIALIFVGPFLVYLFILLIKKTGTGKSLVWLIVLILLTGVLSGGSLIRTQKTYGEVFRPEEIKVVMNANVNLRAFTSNLFRNSALQVSIPGDTSKIWLNNRLAIVLNKLDLDINDPGTTMDGQFSLPGFNTSELSSGNPIHTILIPISFVAVIILFIMKAMEWETLVYVGGILVAGILFNFLLKTDSTGSRLQMPFYFLYAPIVGYLLGRLEKNKIGRWVGVVLFVFALPWLFATKERPLVVINGITSESSILSTKREELYFSSQPESFEFISQSVESIKNNGVFSIGLAMNNDFAEYPLWALLGAPNSDYQIEHIVSNDKLSGYTITELKPQAIFCDDCENLLDAVDNFTQVGQGKRGEKLFLLNK